MEPPGVDALEAAREYARRMRIDAEAAIFAYVRYLACYQDREAEELVKKLDEARARCDVLDMAACPMPEPEPEAAPAATEE